MSSVAKKAGIIGLVVLAAIIIVAVEFLRRNGQFHQIRPHFAGMCKTLAMEGSAEDVRIDHGTRLAYLSYLDRRAIIAGGAVNGTVMLIDLRAPEPRLRAALTSEPPDFRPHGMSLYTPRYGTRKLFVVSHPASGEHRIEIFEQTRTGLFAPVRTVTHPWMTSPAAILAVGPRQFYVLNDSGATTGTERFEEAVLRRGFARLLYFDGQAMKVVATGLKAPTGLASSHDGQSLYVSDTLGERLKIFARNIVTGHLRRTETVPLGSAPDNITLDEHGDVWIAAHPKLFAWMRTLRDPEARAPSQVFRYSPAAPEKQRLTEVFLDAGERISAGSVAAVHGERLLIGSLTEPKLLDCRMSRTGVAANAD